MKEVMTLLFCNYIHMYVLSTLVFKIFCEQKSILAMNDLPGSLVRITVKMDRRRVCQHIRKVKCFTLGIMYHSY